MSKKKRKKPKYNIAAIFDAMELELVASMNRNLKNHEDEEIDLGFKWEMWQQAKLMEIESFKRRNMEIIERYQIAIKDIVEYEIRTAIDEADTTFKVFVEDIKNEVYDEVIDVSIKYPTTLEPIFVGEQGESLRELMKEKPEVERAWKQALRPKEELFFRTNDKLIETLIKSSEDDMKKASIAVLRRAEDEYRKVIFEATMAPAMGAKTLNQAVDFAVKKFLDKGMDAIVYKDGKKVPVRSYADMAIRTARHRAYVQASGAKRSELGVYTIVVSSHGSACDLCIPWQGQILIDDVFTDYVPNGTEKYPLLSTAIEAGLLHPNCRHNLSTFYVGINTLPEIVPDEKVKANYKDEQTLRKYEREIRKLKRHIAGFTDPENIKLAKDRLKQIDKQINELINKNKEIRRKPERES